MARFQLYRWLFVATCLTPSSVLALDSFCTKPESTVEKTVCSNQTLRREEALTMRVAETIYKQLSKKDRPQFEKEFADWRADQIRQFSSSIGDELPEGLQNKSIHDELIFGLHDYYLRKRVQLLEQKPFARIVTRLATQLYTQMQAKQVETRNDATQLFAEIIEAVARQTEIADELYLGRSVDLITPYSIAIGNTAIGNPVIAYKTNGGSARSDYEFYLFRPRNSPELFSLIKFDFFDEEKQKIDGTIEALGAVEFKLDPKSNKIVVHDFAPTNPNCESIYSYRLEKDHFALERLTKSTECETQSGNSSSSAKTDQLVVFDRKRALKNTGPVKGPQHGPDEPKRSNG